MTEILFFNPSNLHQRFIDSANSAQMDKLKADGWLQNPPLIHMHHPGLHDDKLVLKSDEAIWEHKGYYAEPTCVYHPQDGIRTVPKTEAKKLLQQGWYDSPAKFPGNNDDGETPVAMQAKLKLQRGAA